MEKQKMNMQVKRPAAPSKEEQILAQRAQIYMQKKEHYTLNAAIALLKNVPGIPENDAIDHIIDKADYFGEKLMEKLFAMPEDENQEAGPGKED